MIDGSAQSARAIRTICSSELKAGDIVSVMPEEKFKDGQRISSIKLRGRENLNVNISGKIDRVDVFASRKTRIIDYKTFDNKLNILKSLLHCVPIRFCCYIANQQIVQKRICYL